MNKKELATVVVLVLLIPVWLLVDATFIKPRFPEPEPLPTATPAPEIDAPATPVPDPEGVETEPEEGSPGIPPALVSGGDVASETTRLENEVLAVTLSNLGAVVERATLKEFPDTLEDKGEDVEEPVVLAFDVQGMPALQLGLPGIAPRAGFQARPLEDRNGVRYVLEVQPGLALVRDIVLGDRYELEVTDRWVNQGDTPLSIPVHTLGLGPMEPRPEASQKYGPFVGVDARHRSSGVTHYVKKLNRGLKKSSGTFRMSVPEDLYWFSVKNKFFTQVLTLELDDWLAVEALEMQAAQGEGDARIGMAQASVRLVGATLRPGQAVERNYRYFVGPMSMAELKQLGDNQQGLIDFRLFKIFVPLGTAMMSGLHFLYGVTHNWGLAIILLTFVVRMLFWPLTQKGTENMKRMSELSPQMKEMREKYKNNPQKLNTEMSAFYKKHKVNPMAGCLPMVVQIPVFISLYGVLRVAVELRYAGFLWIRDLSEPEALFHIGDFAVNILPLTMGATMVLQQRLTPSNMDEQQKKIMMMMPIVFLFITYGMPSGLLLYWTTSNLISIYQTLHTRKRDKKRSAAKASAGSATAANRAKPAKNARAAKAGGRK